MISKKENIRCECQYSDDLQHRFTLKRIWNKDKPLACVITIHPNTSDNIHMDMTTFLTINGIVNLEEFGGVILVNLFSVITNKLHMRWARDVDVNHPENDIYIQKAAEESSIVLLAYGKGVMNNIRIVNRINQVLTLLSKYQDKLMVISDGERSFLHPLTPSTRSVVWKLVPFSHEEHIILTKNRKKAVDETLIPEENANQEATAEEAKESVPT